MKRQNGDDYVPTTPTKLLLGYGKFPKATSNLSLSEKYFRCWPSTIFSNLTCMKYQSKKKLRNPKKCTDSFTETFRDRVLLCIISVTSNQVRSRCNWNITQKYCIDNTVSTIFFTILFLLWCFILVKSKKIVWFTSEIFFGDLGEVSRQQNSNFFQLRQFLLWI